MDIPDLITDTAAEFGPVFLYGAPAALLALIVLGWLLRRWARGRGAARIVSAVATLLGLAWSAQGMWDAAVHSYGVVPQIASVLFVVFEAMVVSAMLKAHEYRDHRGRRARFVRAVWTIACVMGLVVAFGEGWGQAPLRLAVPLLVAFNWWLDLTADDNPDEKPPSELRWTPREIGLHLGLLRITDSDQRDATAAERAYLERRIARLAFAEHHGSAWAGSLLRRRTRLARLKLDADPAMLAAVGARLRLSSAPLSTDAPPPVEQPAPEVHPVTPPQPEPPIIVKPAQPAEAPSLPAKQKELAYRLMRESITDDNPEGMTAVQLAAASGYSKRSAETIVAAVRKDRKAEPRINGHALTMKIR